MRVNRSKHFLIILIVAMLPIVGMAQSFYDIIIRNGKVVDGSGNPWFIADVGVKDGKIVRIGNLGEATAEKVIDAKGLIVAPGFIDVHTHIEGSEIRIPTAGNFILDGVTSVVTGNCGGSSLDIAEYFRKIDSVKTSINIATLIGHNTVRRAVLGEYQRDPTPEE